MWSILQSHARAMRLVPDSQRPARAYSTPFLLASPAHIVSVTPSISRENGLSCERRLRLAWYCFLRQNGCTNTMVLQRACYSFFGSVQGCRRTGEKKSFPSFVGSATLRIVVSNAPTISLAS